MPTRQTTRSLIVLLAAASLLTGTAATARQSDPFSGSACQSADTACRLDGVERRLDYLIDLMERRPERSGGGREGRSVDIPVNQGCTWSIDGCSVLAARLCSQGGFARGVPLETEIDTLRGPQLKRATCMD